MGKFRQTKKDLLGKSSQGSRNKVSWKAFLQALGKCFFSQKKWFKIFKIYIIYDLLVYMGSKKAYAGINLGDSGYSWNYAREIWSNTNHVKKPTKTPNKTLFFQCFHLFTSSRWFYHVLPCYTCSVGWDEEGYACIWFGIGSQNGLQEKHLQCLQCKEIPAALHGTFSLKHMLSPRLGWILYERPRFSGSKDAQNILVSYIDIPLRIPLNDSGFGGTRLWRRCLLGSDARHWGGNSILPTCGRNNPRASDDIYPLFSTGQFAGAQNVAVLFHFGDMGLLWWFIAPPGKPTIGYSTLKVSDPMAPWSYVNQ